MDTPENFKLFDLSVFGDERGQLVAIEKGANCPFAVRRAFYIYDVTGTQTRGEHANKNSEFLFITLKGSCKILCDDGAISREFTLNDPKQALWTNKMTWKEMRDFSKDAVLLVLSSEEYDAQEYIRNYEEFSRCAKTMGGGESSE